MRREELRLRTRPEVRRHRRHVLAIDDPVAVDILRAAVARAKVADDLPEVGSVHTTAHRSWAINRYDPRFAVPGRVVTNPDYRSAVR